MPIWRLAKSLIQLRAQINAAHPTRSKVSDGTVGDTAHAARKSEHNPDSQGRVCAMDVTHHPEAGVNGFALGHQLIKDKRCMYVIFNGMIWKARTRKWEVYRGVNAHRKHVHISAQAATADDPRPWNLSQPTYPLLKRGSTDEQAVRTLQTKLKATGAVIAIDGLFGKITEHEIKLLQRKHGMAETGMADASVWEVLG